MSLYIDNQLSEKELMYFKSIDVCAECRTELEGVETLVSPFNGIAGRTS